MHHLNLHKCNTLNIKQIPLPPKQRILEPLGSKLIWLPMYAVKMIEYTYLKSGLEGYVLGVMDNQRSYLAMYTAKLIMRYVYNPPVASEVTWAERVNKGETEENRTTCVQRGNGWRDGDAFH